MAEAVKGDRGHRRRYDSSRRREQARQTQLAILRAAHDLFVTKGYGRTTITDIAATAGVSPELIYATFKSKAGLLPRVWDITIGGDDDDVVFHERPEIRALRAEPDLEKRLRLWARTQVATARRMAPFLLALQGAAASEPAAAEMLAEIGRQRLAGMTVMATEAAATGQLAVSMEQCRDFAWSLTDGVLWHRLVVERGWSDDEVAEWLGQIYVAVLVGVRDDPRAATPRGG
jgi:AcrR family transcriptional regulator